MGLMRRRRRRRFQTYQKAGRDGVAVRSAETVEKRERSGFGEMKKKKNQGEGLGLPTGRVRVAVIRGWIRPNRNIRSVLGNDFFLAFSALLIGI